MCLKHEREYPNCFDFLFFGISHDSWLDNLRDYYSVHIEDSPRLQRLLLNALDTAHEEGVIRPKTDAEVEADKAAWLKEFHAKNKREDAAK